MIVDRNPNKLKRTPTTINRNQWDSYNECEPLTNRNPIKNDMSRNQQESLSNESDPY